MPEWWLLRADFEFVLCLVMMFQCLAKKNAEFEPSEPSSSSSRDIYVCRTTQIWHYEDWFHIMRASKT